MNKKRFKRKRPFILSLVLTALTVIYLNPNWRAGLRNWIFSLASGATEISLPSSPKEMGEIHGEKRAYAIKLLSEIYVNRMLCKNDPELRRRHEQRAIELFAKIPSRWTEEITAVATAASVKTSILMLGNTFLDLGLQAVGCRTLVVAADDGLKHAHNLDWDNLGGVGNFLVTLFRSEGDVERLPVVWLGFPGMVGALDAINAKGVAISFNQVGFSNGECDFPLFLKMREIMETCSTFADAEAKITNMPVGMPFCLALSDANTNEAAIFERDADMKVFKRSMSDGVLTADNNLWFGRKAKGLCVIDDVARTERPRDVEGMKRVLRHEKVLMECNIYSVIFDHANNRLLLACGEIPAAKGVYESIRLFADEVN